MKDIKIKGGKAFKTPSIFLNPHSEQEGRILRETNAQFPYNEGGYGVEHIDGIVSYLKDWKEVSKGLQLTQTDFSTHRPLSDRILLILPELESLLKGIEDDRTKMYSTGLFDSNIRDTIERIVETDPTTSKRLDSLINEIYPLLDARLTSKLLGVQLDNHASILALPTVPIISVRQLDRQLDKANAMINDSNTILKNVFTAYHNKIDTMNFLTMTSSVIKSENYNSLIGTLLNNSPDHVAIRIININPANENQILSIFNFILALYNTIRETGKTIPIHLLGLDHLSYFAWTYGLSTTVLPIVQDPYFFGKRGADQPPKPKNGVYYDPEDRQFYTKDLLYTKTRDVGYKLPCYCDICKKFETLPKVNESYWNEFRRIHTILVRNIELKMIREALVPTNIALREMFLRSKKLGWTQFLPDKPAIAF